MIPKKLMGIIGHPLGHSLSPLLHNWAFGETGEEAVYMAWPLPPEQLEDFVKGARVLPVAGASVTIPHKETVMPFLDRISKRGETIGAVNTLYWRDNELCGENTDIIGFLAPVQGESFKSALVLGAGGAARAVLAGLQELGVPDIMLTNRSQERLQALAEEFNVTPLPWEERATVTAQLLVNSTPLGMKGDKETLCPLPDEYFQPGQVAYDLVYNPLQTVFLQKAEAAGCRCIDGLTMFLGQAAAQFHLWTGRDFPLEGGRKLLIEALGL